MKERRTARQIWAMPLMLALVSGAGLGAALLVDGVGDALACVAVAMPLFVILGAWIRASR